MGPIIGAVAIFIVAALLYYQGLWKGTEHFQNQTPVAGRWYVADEEGDGGAAVPADLNRAPSTIPASHQTVPTSHQRPTAIPGAPTAPREAPAQRKDLYELDTKISTWLAAAAQYESEHPGGLTTEQLQRRVILQGRLASIRNQLGTSQITDTYRQVAGEIDELRHENSGWGRGVPSVAAVHGFAHNQPADSFLTAPQYREFRRIFDAVLNEYAGHTQPNPLERVRMQQLQVFQQDLLRAERTASAPPPIRVAAARSFLQQSLRPDQPLPTLFSMEPNPATLPPSFASSPDDVIRQLKDIKWRLTVTYDPAGAELDRTVTALLKRMMADDVRPSEIEAARSALVDIQGFVSGSGSPPPVRPTMEAAAPAPLKYDPANLRRRAVTLCKQVTEAFSATDAAALGCPTSLQALDTEGAAESTINIVCDRLRYSVPSVSPQQFNCPPHKV